LEGNNRLDQLKTRLTKASSKKVEFRYEYESRFTAPDYLLRRQKTEEFTSVGDWHRIWLTRQNCTAVNSAI